MIKEYVNIDGQKSGILVKIKNDSKKPNYIVGKDKKPRLFYNLEVAKLISTTAIPNASFEYFICVGKIIVPIDNCQRFDNVWQFIYNEKLYIVKEYNLRKTTSLGYICFENGATQRCDKKYGSDRQFELMKIIRDVLSGIICEKGEYGITSIKKHSKEYIVQVRGTTGKIHILHNCKLMDINQAKRAKSEKCLPFRKEMDKFTTFYVYTDKDISEPLRNDAEGKLSTILQYIVDDLQSYYSDLNPEYVPVNYSGYIEFTED